MNYIWENGKKPSFRPNFGPSKFFFVNFYLYHMLEIVATSVCNFKEK